MHAAAGASLHAGCWTLAEIRAGRAIAAIAGGTRLVGLRPDGPRTMTVRGGGAITVVPPGSVIDVPTRLAPGARVTVALGR